MSKKISLAQLKKNQTALKSKITREKKKLQTVEKNKSALKKDIREQYDKIIDLNKQLEATQEKIFKRKVDNQIEGQRQRRERNKGKNQFSAMEADLKIEELKIKRENPDFKDVKTIEKPDGDYFEYQSAFYYYNQTKKKLMQMLKDKEIKSINGSKSQRKAAETISDIFLDLDSESSVLIEINMETDAAFISVIERDPETDVEQFIEPEDNDIKTPKK